MLEGPAYFIVNLNGINIQQWAMWRNSFRKCHVIVSRCVQNQVFTKSLCSFVVCNDVLYWIDIQMKFEIIPIYSEVRRGVLLDCRGRKRRNDRYTKSNPDLSEVWRLPRPALHEFEREGNGERCRAV